MLDSFDLTQWLTGTGVVAGIVGAALVIVPHVWSLCIRPSAIAPVSAMCGWCLLVLAGLAGHEIPGYRIIMLGAGAAGLLLSLVTKFAGTKLRDLACVATACGVLSIASQSWSVAFARIDESLLASNCITMMVEWKPANDVYAITDRGTKMTLHVPARPDYIPAGIMHYESPREFNATALTEVDIRANCHGFTFTGGRFLIASEDVMAIVSDNGYERVSEPRPGDVAIYFDANSRVPEHTGIVRKVHDSKVLVESKWGIGKRYLHSLLDQPYGNRVEFYRTPRGGHQLAIHQRSVRQPFGDTSTLTAGGRGTLPVPVPTSSRVLGSGSQQLLMAD